MRWLLLLCLPLTVVPLACGGCGKGHDETDGGTDGAVRFDGGGSDAGPVDAGMLCSLPGSIQYTATGTTVVPGGMGAMDLSFLHLPAGFCAHPFANVGNPRQLRFAPGGELFVASPTTGTTSGGPNGKAAIVLLPDDNHDGYADDIIPFLSNLPSTQGLLFAPGVFYYQDHVNILSLPYQAGDRTPSGASQTVAAITYYEDGLHWPKSLDIADDSTVYVANGGSQGNPCVEPHTFVGGILSIDAGAPGGVQVAQGFRNPIAVRCERGHNLCFALELAKDATAGAGGREKLVPIRSGDDWGFPCCASFDTAYPGIVPTPNCSMVTADTNSFIIGETPFGLDFEPGIWPDPWTKNAFVVLHGAAGTWSGARLVAIPTDAVSGFPSPSTDINGSVNGMQDFATGWDDNTHGHGRPTEITFSSDGRLFLSNDQNGDIFWIAPMGM